MEHLDTTVSQRARAVLVVEDDPDIRLALCECLEETDAFKVAAAEHGAEALRQLDGMERPCVVILDMLMPVMSGYGFLDELAKRPDRRDFRVIVASASVVLERVKDLPGVTSIVRKPYELADILSLIDTH